MNKLHHLLHRGVIFLRSERRHQLERVVGLALVAASLFFLSATLIRSWGELKPHLARISIKPLVIGQLFVIGALILGAVMWALVQRGLGLGFSWTESLSIHLVSSITKYVPGYAWQYMSKAYLSRKQGGQSRQITFAILTEFILLITSGVSIAAPWGFLGNRNSDLSWDVPGWVWLLIGVLGPLVSIGWILVVPRLATPREKPRACARPLSCALAIGMVGWIMFAAAVWFTSRSLYPVTLSVFPQHVVALVASAILGIVIVIVPAGLGVREASLAALLSGIIPFTLGIIVGLVVRSSIIFWELVGVGIGFHLARARDS